MKTHLLAIGLCVAMLGSAVRAAPAADDSDTAAVDKLLDMPLEELMDIATGTRDVGVKAQQSSAPIQVISADDLAATGQNNVFDALMDLVPSLSWASNYDLGNIVRSARLRGMSPGEVLVLIDGKRRHPTARVNATASTDQGTNPVDLEMIPLSMIDHVEVLLDGASAQYGSDAVAGVINFILKKADHGTTLTSSAGITSRGDGAKENVGATQGFSLGSDGSLDISVDYRHQDFVHRSANFLGSDVKNYSLDYPMIDLLTGGFNLEKPINQDIDLYAFGTAARRTGQTTENVRVTSVFDPTVPASDVTTGVTGLYPRDFVPHETLDEVDGALTAGIRGRHLAAWDWDLSTTYGRDSQNEGVIDTVNPGLVVATGYSPTSIYAGNQTTSQLTSNLDLRRPFQTSLLSAPINVALGLEHRFETYTQGAGDPAGYVLGGTEAFTSNTPSDASASSRNVEAAYIDLSTRPVPQWVVDAAGRFENYDDRGVGSTENGKLTTRYDITPQLGLRATLSNGFHAPTLAQSHFSATTVYPQENGGQLYVVQLPVASAGGTLLGAPPLKPEMSNNFDFGLVAEPLPQLHVTLDSYQVFLANRIIDTGALPGPGAPASAAILALAAAAANGNVISPGSTSQIRFFTNGADTRTRGLDLSVDYLEDFGPAGKIKWSLNANDNQTRITKYYAPSTTLAAAGLTYYNPEVINDLTKAAPQNHIALSANYRQDRWDLTVRETRYGHADFVNQYTEVPYYNLFIKSAYITDIDLGYYVMDGIKLSIGGNNVFDHLPSAPVFAAKDTSDRDSNRYPLNTPWGIDGAFFYTKISATF